MKLVLTFIALCSFQLTHGQCNPTIPNSVTPITLNMVTLTSGDFWICENLLSTDNNTASNIYLEENSSLNCFGCTSEIWVKTGCTVNIYSNGTPTVHMMPGSSVIDVSGMATIDSCSSITYDYTDVPSGGCVPASVNSILSTQTKLYPNPNNGNFNLDLPVSLKQSYTARVYSIKGELIETLNVSSSNSIDLDLVNGYYLIEIQTENQDIIRKSLIIK